MDLCLGADIDRLWFKVKSKTYSEEQTWRCEGTPVQGFRAAYAPRAFLSCTNDCSCPCLIEI